MYKSASKVNATFLDHIIEQYLGMNSYFITAQVSAKKARDDLVHVMLLIS